MAVEVSLGMSIFFFFRPIGRGISLIAIPSQWAEFQAISGPVRRFWTRGILSRVAAVAHPADSDNVSGVFDDVFSPERQILS